MSSNNNNDSGLFGDNNNNASPKEIQERQEEMQLLTRFKDVVTNRLEQMTSELEQMPKEAIKEQKKYKMGEHEKKILLEMQGMGLAEGMAAGIATFLLLRRGPIWIGNFIVKRRGGGAATGNVPKNPFQNASTMSSPIKATGGYQLSNPLFASSTNPNFPRSRSPIIRAIWFVFDTTLSLMMAANVSMQYTDLRRIRDDLVELPLAEGKSLVSEAFCESLTQELQKVQQENSPAYQRLVQQYQKRQSSDQFSNFSSSSDEAINPLALYMEGITLFTQNCERRAFRQREIFQEQGGTGFAGSFDDDTTTTSSSDDLSSIPIPPPGIAKDGPRLVRNYNGGKDEYSVVQTTTDHNESSGEAADDSDYWKWS